MATAKKRVDFYNSIDGIEIRKILVGMSQDMAFNTDSGYSANSQLYPDNLMPFVDKHMSYLNTHPNIDVRQYLANLRLMTRLR